MPAGCAARHLSASVAAVPTSMSNSRPMTDPDRATTCGHAVHHECVMCGRQFQTSDVILPGGYCGPGCRKMAWSLRRAEAAIDTPATEHDGLTRDSSPRAQPTVAPRSLTPVGIDGWERLLSRLGEQLNRDPRLLAHRRRLRAALTEALEQLDSGLDS